MARDVHGRPKVTLPKASGLVLQGRSFDVASSVNGFDEIEEIGEDIPHESGNNQPSHALDDFVPLATGMDKRCQSNEGKRQQQSPSPSNL